MTAEDPYDFYYKCFSATRVGGGGKVKMVASARPFKTQSYCYRKVWEGQIYFVANLQYSM